LPIKDVSANKLGKYKLETTINRGIYKAGKTYLYEVGDKSIIKAKGVKSNSLTNLDFDNIYNGKTVATAIKHIILRILMKDQ